MASYERFEENVLASPMVSALFELREEVDRLFEEQKALLVTRDLDPVTLPSEPPTATLSTSSPPSVPARPVGAAAAASIEVHPPASFRRSTSRVKEMAMIAPEHQETPPRDTDPNPARPEDSRQRLDALAKLLDKRLKPSNTG